MAKDKKSFILYCDSISIIERLSDERAGKLIKHIFRYCSDMNPEADDEVVDMAFEHFKTILKRDLVRYNNIVERNKNNGSKGGRPKKEETEVNQENPMGYLATKENPQEPKKADTDNDNGILLEKETKVDWSRLLIQFNEITKKKCIVVSDKAKRQLLTRLKEGYTKQSIVDAITNCFNDEYHISTGHKYLTLEFISRSDKMEKFSTMVGFKSITKKEDKL